LDVFQSDSSLILIHAVSLHVFGNSKGLQSYCTF
jgi:hypothetical protein